MNLSYKHCFVVFVAASLMLFLTPISVFAAGKIVAKGTIVGVDGHGARGSVQIIKNGKRVVARFSQNLLFDRVPDAWLAFGKNGKFLASTYVASFKRNRGAVTIKIPAQYANGNYDTLFIWCRRFNVGIGSAKLK